MPATVVTPQNFQTFVETGKAEHAEELPPTRREKLTLKPAEPAKSEAQPSEKVDVKPAPVVKDAGTDSKPKIKLEDIPEDQLPEHVRKIIGKKHREMKEATEFAEFQRLGRLTAEKRVQELEAQLAKSKPEPVTEPTRATGDEPKPEDFPNVAAYTKALVKWERAQEQQTAQQQQADDAEKERQTKANQNWQTRLAAVMEANPDFEETVSAAFKADDRKVAKVVIDYIEESDVGPQLLYHLSKNPEQMATFRSLNAEKAIGFLGRLEAKLEAPAAAKEPAPEPKAETPVKKVSQAPAPIDTTVGSAEVVKKDPSEMTTEEYLAYKRAQRAQRR